MTDYSLWEVIKNGNKVLKRTVRETEQEYEPTTTEEKQDKRNEMKASGTLLMALLNKDQLKFHSYKDAKLLMEAIEKRYGGNKESKKVQRTLLKQQYENFAGSSSEIIDQTFDSTNSNSITNEADNTAYRVSAAHTQSNPTSGDNLKEMELQWEMAMLTIRARRFIKRTGRKLDINGQRVGFDRHMTGNKCYLTEYEDYDGGFVSFGDGKGRISGKDKKNNVLFTDTECLVLSSDFKLLDESQVLLRVSRKDNIYSVDLKSVVPTKGLTCLFTKATIDKSNLWHRR
ncbi:hypothetical protein Tco_0195519 [Tanacetum coccineum]